MKITIELTHEDIINADPVNFQAFFLLYQSFAKSLKEGDKNILREAVHDFATKKEKSAGVETSTDTKNSQVQKSEHKVETNFNRKEIEDTIKKIALEGKEKNISVKIKECIKSFGVEKLSEVPDEKMTELLQKVQEIE